MDAKRGLLFSPPQLNLGEWAAVGTGSGGDGSLNSTVNALAVINGDLYVGGSFTNVVNNGIAIGAADYIAKWDGTNWSALGYGNSPSNGSLNAAVNALAVIGTDLYVGGSFQDVNNYGTALTAADRIAKWDGSNWSAVGNGSGTQGSIGNTVNALAVVGTDLFIGGSFLDVNNSGVTLGAADKVAMWDGSNWSALG